MQFSRFMKLVKLGEQAHVDFKEQCHAFASPTVKPNAELVKDICAMANNGSVTSYLLIGVSDDRRFVPVKNAKLTDDNLQALCKDGIYPPPKVRLHRFENEGHLYFAVQIGPNSRRAYRLNRDFISYKEEVCFRRNDVWIRRGATTDLGTPEEVANLVAGRMTPATELPEPNVVYAQLKYGEKPTAMARDLSTVVQESGHQWYDDALVICTEGERYVMRACVIESASKTQPVWKQAFDGWRYAHGMVVMTAGGVTEQALGCLNWSQVTRFKTPFGWYFTFPMDNSTTEHMLPANSSLRFDNGLMPMFVFTNVKCTADVYRAWSSLIEFLGDSHPAIAQLALSKQLLTSNLTGWLRDGWYSPTGSYYIGGPPEKLNAGEVFVGDHSGGKVVHVSRPTPLEDWARRILALSQPYSDSGGVALASTEGSRVRKRTEAGCIPDSGVAPAL